MNLECRGQPHPALAAGRSPVRDRWPLGAAGWCGRFATGTLGVVEFFTSPDLWVAFLTLFVLEVVLGVDNVVFISVLAGKLPSHRVG